MISAQEIGAALRSDRLEVHFQPVVLLPSWHIVGFEALARLRGLDGELAQPSAFVPVAEASGLIGSLGLHVLRTSVQAAAAWRSRSTGLATATVSVNVAPSQLEEPGFVDVVRALLAECELPGSALVLEITESTATSAWVRPVLERLSAIGVRIALDDFGIGFATLDNVRRLPVHVLKLDRSFVAGVTQAGADRAIARVVVDLADSLGLSVIAEGVETVEQAQELVRLGCPVGQGYLFSEAVRDPAAAVALVAAARGPERGESGEVTEGWSVELDGAVIAAARLLGPGGQRASRTDGPHRATLHAYATALARRIGMPESAVRTVARLALVHDLGRLSVDGALPQALTAPELRGLIDLTDDPLPGVQTGRRRTELEIIALARKAAARETSESILEAACEVRERSPQLAQALTELVDAPPVVVPLAEVIDDLDRRRVGRRGMEQRLRSLVGITRVLGSPRDSLELMRVALEEVRRIVGAASASIERWDRDNARLTTLVNVGQLGPDEVTFPRGEFYELSVYTQARHTMLTGLPFIHTVDDPDAPEEAVAVLESLQKYSSAAIPVYLDGRAWGQVWLTTTVGEPPFAASDIETLTAIATLMGGVIAQAENLDQVSRLAFEDPLTRVANRRSVDDALQQLAASGQSVAVAVLDVDLLREVNETAGYARGDRALIDLAEALSRALIGWPGSSVGRLGSDDFCVTIPGGDRADAQALVGDALRRLEQAGDGPQVSVGIAVSGQDWTPREVLAEADAALYRVKSQARLRRRSASSP